MSLPPIIRGLTASYMARPAASLLSSWNPREPTPCNWTGVSCSRTACITSLDLFNALLSGPFPLPLYNLPALSSLSLSNNNINSTLPSGISTYHGLTYLNLMENLLSGSILRSLANIPGLRLLDLSYNSLSEGFPAEFARFASLEFFSVLSNLMNRTVPGFLSNVTSLRHLQLDRFALNLLLLILFFTLSLFPFSLSLSLSLSTVVSTHHILSLFPILSQP